MRRVVAWSVVGAVFVVLAGLGTGGWYYSEQLLEVPTAAEDYTIAILAADERTGTVTLPDDAEEDLVGLADVGLRTPEGLLVLDGEVRHDDGGVVRRGHLLSGDWPRPGDPAAVSIDTFAGDPAETLGLPFDTVAVQSELGELPAWRVVPVGARRDDTWVVFIHGRGAHKAEGNRALAVAAEVGLPALSISIRNDPEAAAAPDGFGRYGDAEWGDLQAAIDHLQEVEDAERFVLIGYSQGASLALTFLRRSGDARAVDGAVLVSPLISLDETLALQAQERGIPDLLVPPLLASTRWITTWRSGIDFARLEHLDGLDELPAGLPMLVTHGDADRTVPIGPTRAFAAALSEQVTYVEYEGAGHVREWNVDRERFEAELESFLLELPHGTG